MNSDAEIDAGFVVDSNDVRDALGQMILGPPGIIGWHVSQHPQSLAV